MNIQSFLNTIRRRLNQSATIRALIFSLIVFSGVVLAVACFYLFKGYAVPAWLYILAAVLAVLTGITLFLRKRVSVQQAATVADRTYGLKNGISSYLHLQKEGTGYMAEAQRNWTEERVKECDPKSVPISFSKGRAGLAVILSLAALGIAFIPASERVKTLQTEQELTHERTQEVAKKLKDYVEEMDKDLSEEEREHIDMDKLKIRVESLKPTKDKKEGTRQLAKLEEKAREMSKALQQKRDEKALKNAAEQLKKSLKEETQKLGKDLDADRLKEASEKLAKLSPKELPQNPKKKDLEKARKEIEKLREISKRLANSAPPSQQSGDSQNAQLSQNNEGSPMSQKNQGLAENMLELDEEARKLLEELKKQELSEMRDGQCDCSGFNMTLEELKEALKNMQNKLGQMKAKKKSEQRLAALSKSLSQCQSFMNSPSSSSLSLVPPSSSPGGLMPGTGFAENRKPPGEELRVNGNDSQLTGQKGSGPSLTKIEEAQSGSGVSQKRTTGTAKSMGRQLESFVQRDDVPEELKQGVKEYFKTIHQSDEK